MPLGPPYCAHNNITHAVEKTQNLYTVKLAQ